MLSQEIRRQFLEYFQKRGHTLVPSSSVVPANDPTLLFVNAGMNQFKDLFLGKSQRDDRRATSAQKCVRVGGKHNDLDNVGHTSRHLTFFEMLGNFSFGDYFKKEAIQFAWEVSTTLFGFAPERIWATVFREDEEAEQLWLHYLPKERICRLDEKDNFWAMGDTGPCGPCSELYYDKGPKYGAARSPKEDLTGERYLEFWNLVFMQYDRISPTELRPLPKQSIDTGAGLERVVSLKMGVDSLFETDILRGIIEQIETVSGKRYPGAQDPQAAPFHVIADHLRSLAFTIADGVQPSNSDRGYILRKLVRRAVRYGRTLGLDRPFLKALLPTLLSLMGSDFPELVASEQRIGEILTQEEQAFFQTLRRGSQLLSDVIARSKRTQLMSAEDAFKLKDTYGLPLEEITLVAKDNGLEVDLDGYTQLEKEAKARSREQRKASGIDMLARTETVPSSLFIREETTLQGAEILQLLYQGKEVESLVEGQEGVVILNRTPFYAEKGGQVGDHGLIKGLEGLFAVDHSGWLQESAVLHQGRVQVGILRKGEQVEATIDLERRKKVACNHTATHLLHWALHKVLGEHVRQTGSLVAPDRLRFDFSHHKPLSKEELLLLEDLVNDKIRENRAVHCYEKTLSEVQKDPSIKQFFADKYGSTVRVVDINYSKELCGGTHATRTGEIGYFRIESESSIAAGTRRIEAVTGREAIELTRREADRLQALASLLKSPTSMLVEKTEQLLQLIKELEEKLKEREHKDLLQLAKGWSQAKGILEVAPEIDLRQLATLLKGMHEGVALLVQQNEGRCNLLIQVCGKKEVDASGLLKEALPFIDGKGGGRKESAQGSGSNTARLSELFTWFQRTACR